VVEEIVPARIEKAMAAVDQRSGRPSSILSIVAIPATEIEVSVSATRIWEF
jgi:hypothetical protein